MFKSSKRTRLRLQRREVNEILFIVREGDNGTTPVVKDSLNNSHQTQTLDDSDTDYSGRFSRNNRTQLVDQSNEPDLKGEIGMCQTFIRPFSEELKLWAISHNVKQGRGTFLL